MKEALTVALLTYRSKVVSYNSSIFPIKRTSQILDFNMQFFTLLPQELTLSQIQNQVRLSTSGAQPPPRYYAATKLRFGWITSITSGI
jgi:hypothetical protein